MGKEHVIPQFILRMLDLSKTIKKNVKFPIQGNGSETRSFIYIDDFSKAFLILMKKGKNFTTYNIGTEAEVSINQLVRKIAKNFNKNLIVVPGKLSKGSTLRRIPMIDKLKRLGFKPEISLSEGLRRTVKWYNEQ